MRFVFHKLLLAIGFCAVVGCQGEPPSVASGSPAPAAPAKQFEKVREPAVAGLFYPKDRERSETRQSTGCWPKRKSEPVKNLRALVCPHAGYEFSGPIAAIGYKQLVGRHFSTVILLGPQPLRGVHRGLRIDRRRLPDAAGHGSALAEGGRDGQDRAVFGQSAVRGRTPGLVAPVAEGPAALRRRHARDLGAFAGGPVAVPATHAARLQHRAGGFRAGRSREGGGEDHCRFSTTRR